MVRVPLTTLLIVVLVTPSALAQQAGAPGQSQLDGSETLFTVLAAINAAGYDDNLGSTANSPIRKKLRDALASTHLDSIEALKKFYAAHQQKNGEAELNQYISFALTLNGPPDFGFRLKPEEMPPATAPLRGLETLLADFYAQANIAELWKQAQPAYDEVIAQYHAPVTKVLLEANAYLRNPTSGYMGRRFQVYVDLLGAPNQIESRSYKDDYFVVVTHSIDPQTDAVRHSYLHYLLDPLALKYYNSLDRKKALAEYANGAPALDEAYREDFILLVTECMIKAVESRLATGSQRQALVDQDMREGFVYTPAFAEGLAAYEKQELALRLYYPDLVNEIDLAREEKRFEKVEFAARQTVKKVHVPAADPVLSPAEKTLADAEQFYKSRELEKAKQAYLRVLEQTSEKPMHAKAYYGLARIAALQRDPELSQRLFQKVLDLSPDNETKSWAYLYLGRLADASGDREQATRNYQAALTVEGAPNTVKTAAEKGLKEAFTGNK